MDPRMAALRRALHLLGDAPAGDSRWLSGKRGAAAASWKLEGNERDSNNLCRTFMIIHLKNMDMILSVLKKNNQLRLVDKYLL